MRRKFLVIFLLVLGVSAFFLTKDLFLPHVKKTGKNPPPVTEQKPFVIIIPSYNNEKYVEKNLRSVFTQNYQNYRVIYVSDNSRDETLENAKALLTDLDKVGRATLIHNPINCGALANIYNAVHSCHDKEIVVLLDGDDFFAHENVLNILNQTYADPNVWMTYGNYLDYPTYKQEPQICKKLPENVIVKRSFRNSPCVTTHLRTFYASLFKEIRISDLFFRGRFYSMGWDLAIMLPLLEMSAPRIAYIEDVLYLYNRGNPISDHKLNLAFQRKCHVDIYKKSQYLTLHHLPRQLMQKHSADLVVFSENNPMQLFALLESVDQNVTGLGNTTVFYHAKNSELESHYLEIKLEFPKVQFLKIEDNFKILLNTIAFDSPLSESKYILFAKDSLIVKDQLDLTKAISSLEISQAYSLHFSHHQNLTFSKELDRHLPLPPATPLRGIASGEVPFAWQFSAGTDDWNTPRHFSFALYRKEDIQKSLENLDFASPSSLEYQWTEHIPQEEIGLFYADAKCAFLEPAPHLSKRALSEKFEEGLKIDLNPLFQAQTPSQEISTDLSFISRF
ncbi:MAG: Poly-beta-1,6-N-acetyl-D-glucosamine synthase [Chlamydiae bacterium]|nr:Poly-beta-1,6-N-acetyl-D-glucosamine synthase [Chlamydiota bacterium]